MNLLVALMPLITRLVELYIKSSSSKKDDEVLKLVQDGAKYLANKDNNTLDSDTAIRLNDVIVVGDEK